MELSKSVDKKAHGLHVPADSTLHKVILFERVVVTVDGTTNCCCEFRIYSIVLIVKTAIRVSLLFPSTLAIYLLEQRIKITICTLIYPDIKLVNSVMRETAVFCIQLRKK